MINEKTLKLYQADVKLRYRRYKRGWQQGLGMVWDNMMADLKQGYEKSVKKVA